MPIKSFAFGNGVSSGERWRVGVLEIVIMQIQGWSLLSSLTKKNPSCLESFKSEKKMLEGFQPDAESIRSQSCFYGFNSQIS